MLKEELDSHQKCAEPACPALQFGRVESLPILTDIASEVVTRALRMETMYGALDLLRFADSSAFSWVRW